MGSGLVQTSLLFGLLHPHPSKGRGGERRMKDHSSTSTYTHLRTAILQGFTLLQAPACQELGRASFTGHIVPRTTQLLATPVYHNLTAGRLNSLCHNSVYVGPHKSQVLINLCLQGAKGDKVSGASGMYNHPCTRTAKLRVDLPGTCHIQQGE